MALAHVLFAKAIKISVQKHLPVALTYLIGKKITMK
jgi:hypothetical protein